MSDYAQSLARLGVPCRGEGEHHHATHGWVQTDCPYCSPRSERYRLGHNLAGGYCSCWVCGWHPLDEALSLLTGLSRHEARKIAPRASKGDFSPPRRCQGRLRLPQGLCPLRECHVAYLKGRGHDDVDQLRKVWRLKGIERHPVMGWRIFIPVHVRGEMVSYTCRSIKEVKDKYRNARPEDEALPVGETLYGWDHVRHAVVLHEGPADVWRTGPGAAALLGLNASPRQLSLLSQVPTRYVCFDGEPVAQARAAKLCEQLAGFPGTTQRLELETGKDAGSASEKEIHQLRRLLR